MKIRTDSSEYSRHVLNDIRQLSAEEVLTLHGIRIAEDKSIFDEAYNMTFKDIQEWIAFSENDVDQEDEKFGYDDSNWD